MKTVAVWVFSLAVFLVSQVSADEVMRVTVVGQALVKTDLRTFAPLAVAQAREYLPEQGAVFTNLEVAVAPPDAAVVKRSAAVTHVEPDVLDNLREMGFNMLALSNNHALDLGVAGLFTTIEEVSARGFAYAGTGADAAAAAAAGFLDRPEGRYALIGIASGAVQLVPETWAGPGKPGVNFLQLQEDGTLNAEQHARILDAIRAAAEQADLVIVYHHNHYWGAADGIAGPPGRDLRADRFDTPEWMEKFARDAIDAGAGMYVAHGNPALHGIEIYNGKPILYGLGNYIFQAVAPPDRYGPLAYHSAVMHLEFDADRQVSGIQIRPLVLAINQTEETPRGTPYLAQRGEAEAILQRLVYLSQRYGTTIDIDGETGSVRLR